MSPIKDFVLSYSALNEEDTFSEGDTVAGAVTFTLTKQTKVKSLLVKLKGDANVRWSEGSGDDEKTYSDHRRYFKLKEYIVGEDSKGPVLPPGVHHHKFRFTIPHGDMPSSFKGSHGQIVYMLEAKISRSWRFPSTVKKELNFVSKSILHAGQVICPQSGSVDKEIGVFSKERIHMSATIDRKAGTPGDTLSVVAKICNSTSKKVRPKFNLQMTTLYRAGSSTTTSVQSLNKVVGETITPNSEETVTCQLKIPVDAIPSFHDCEIISVDYCVKVYLDISFAIDPEVVFPLLIVPVSYRAGTPGAPGYSDFPPPAFPIGPYPVPAGPGAYGYPAPHANIASGFNSQQPQQATPYSFSAAAFPPVQNQAATAPPLFQQGEELPTYMSLFPPPHDPYGSTGSNKKI